MRTPTLVLAFAATLFGSVLHAQDFDKKQAAADAKQVVQGFAKSLKSELLAAMQKGGPEHALGVCNIEAMPITAKAGSANDSMVSRVSLKNRNPDNVPNDWQREILEQFDARAADGEDIAPMASVTVADVDGKKQLRFMKAVPTEARVLPVTGKPSRLKYRASSMNCIPTTKQQAIHLAMFAVPLW